MYMTSYKQKVARSLQTAVLYGTCIACVYYAYEEPQWKWVYTLNYIKMLHVWYLAKLSPCMGYISYCMYVSWWYMHIQHTVFFQRLFSTWIYFGIRACVPSFCTITAQLKWHSLNIVPTFYVLMNIFPLCRKPLILIMNDNDQSVDIRMQKI